jgi:circadian clock protein KaiC
MGLAYSNIEALRADMFRFATNLRRKGLTTILITENVGEGTLSRFGVEEFITDSFIQLGLERRQGELRRTLTVRKMRFTRQESSIHPFVIMNKGIVVAADEKVV